jgi:hypothetical protein
VINGKGINYKSDKGVYTMGPGLETIYSGAAYEDEVDEDILVAITPTDTDTLRFVTPTGILTYNEFFNAWSKDSSASLVPTDATLYNNKFHVLTDTELLRENLNKWTDGNRIIVYPTKQKCEAFRFKIEATGTSGTEQSLNLNFVAVEAGIKSGLPKQLPVAQRIGVTTI